MSAEVEDGSSQAGIGIVKIRRSPNRAMMGSYEVKSGDGRQRRRHRGNYGLDGAAFQVHAASNASTCLGKQDAW
jgi:hypothetical protein